MKPDILSSKDGAPKLAESLMAEHEPLQLPYPNCPLWDDLDQYERTGANERWVYDPSGNMSIVHHYDVFEVSSTRIATTQLDKLSNIATASGELTIEIGKNSAPTILDVYMASATASIFCEDNTAIIFSSGRGAINTSPDFAVIDGLISPDGESYRAVVPTSRMGEKDLSWMTNRIRVRGGNVNVHTPSDEPKLHTPRTQALKRAGKALLKEIAAGSKSNYTNS